MNVDAAAAGTAALAGGDDDLVHFLVTNTDGKGLPSFRLTVPKKHLESLPSSYLSAMSSERWVGNSTDRGTAVSPFAVSIDACPPNIRAIWDKYCHHAPDLVPFIQKAYARAVATATTSEEKQMVLLHGMDLEDAVHFLEYYGLVPQNQDILNMLVVPEDAPAAVMLRSLMYPKEAKLVKATRDAVVNFIRKNLERTTYFVFPEASDNIHTIYGYNQSEEADDVVPIHHDFRAKRQNFEFDIKTQFLIDEVGRKSSLRAKLVSHLTEVDQLQAEFVTEEVILVDPKKLQIPKGKKEQQTLVTVDFLDIDREEEQNMLYEIEDEDLYYASDRRMLRWRHVLKVHIPDA